MKKLLILIFLSLATTATAVDIQRSGEGYVLYYQNETGKHCLGMPQYLDLNTLPTCPMSLEDAAKRMGWNKPTGEQLTTCLKLMEDIWTVQPYRDSKTRPVYKISADGKKTSTKIDVVNVGKRCDEFVQSYSATVTKLTWRRVVGNNDKEGAAVCEKQ